MDRKVGEVFTSEDGTKLKVTKAEGFGCEQCHYNIPNIMDRCHKNLEYDGRCSPRRKDGNHINFVKIK